MSHWGRCSYVMQQRKRRIKFKEERYTTGKQQNWAISKKLCVSEGEKKTDHTISLWKSVNGTVRKTVSYIGSRLQERFDMSCEETRRRTQRRYWKSMGKGWRVSHVKIKEMTWGGQIRDGF